MHVEVRCSRTPSTKCLEEDFGCQKCKLSSLRRRAVFPEFFCHTSIFSGRLTMRPLHTTCRYVIKMRSGWRGGGLVVVINKMLFLNFQWSSVSLLNLPRKTFETCIPDWKPDFNLEKFNVPFFPSSQVGKGVPE